MNKLELIEEYNSKTAKTYYYVRDRHTLYIRTTNKNIAVNLRNHLKQEQEELNNASKV